MSVYRNISGDNILKMKFRQSPGSDKVDILFIPFFIILCSDQVCVNLSAFNNGGIAQPARARGSQSRGQGFNSPYLHDQAYKTQGGCLKEIRE